MSGSATGAGHMAGAGGPIVVDDAPAYDALMSLYAVAQPRLLGRGAWRAWAETTASSLSVEQWRRARKWFAEASTGPALVALIPLLTGARDLGDLAAALEALPLSDMMRIAVTADLIAPQTPLDPDDLLALRGDLAAARHFCDRYLRESGRRRTVLIRLLTEPEEARAEIVALLREHDAQVFRALAPQLADERQRAVVALRAQIERDGGAAPAFIRGRDDLAGFSPVIIGVSTLLDEGLTLYYHDIDRTLIDGRAYEPFIAAAGARNVLGLARRRRGAVSAGSAERGADPATHWATVYAALADPSRLQIVRLLAERSRYGQELAAALGISGATVSHHLGALNKAGVLAMERRAHRTYFVLDPHALRDLLREGEQFALGAPAPTSDDGAAHDAREEMN